MAVLARSSVLRWTAAVATAVALAATPVEAAPALGRMLGRTEALRALTHADTEQRAAAVEALAEAGTMPDAERVAERLRDSHPGVREAAQAALWRIWSRSGNTAIDKLFARGVEEMSKGALEPALVTFGEIVRRKPEFAEGWNKRATVLFLLGRYLESLQDCEQVLKRSPRHFGALSGMTQIHLRLGNPEAALQAWERALQANPNLEGGAETLRLLEKAVRARGGART